MGRDVVLWGYEPHLWTWAAGFNLASHVTLGIFLSQSTPHLQTARSQ